MPKYIENPKTKDSGIICCIPHSGKIKKGICPNRCKDCFFQSKRSYLEPLTKNLPNMPSKSEAKGRVIRVNDGHDSSISQEMVIKACKIYKDKFYNTACYRDENGRRIKSEAIPGLIEKFDAPVVLTINPSKMTDESFHRLDPIPKNLMFVRFRIDTWNYELADEAINYYTSRKIPVILTFMAYYTEDLPEGEQENYEYKKRSINKYWAIKPEAWNRLIEPYNEPFAENPYIYTCGKNANTHACHRCGNCLREYYATKERLRK